MRAGWRRLSSACAIGVAVAACSTPSAPEQAIPADVGVPTFLSVTNDPGAALVVGSHVGVWVSRDVGRTWRFLHPIPRDATAIGYGPSRVVIARGTLFDRRDQSLRGVRGLAQVWPFAGRVTAVASEWRARRLWAVASTGAGAHIAYTNDDGVSWWVLPAMGLCARPRRPPREGVRPRSSTPPAARTG